MSFEENFIASPDNFNEPEELDFEVGNFIFEQVKKIRELSALIKAKNDPEIIERFDEEFGYLDWENIPSDSAEKIENVWQRLFNSRDKIPDITKKIEEIYTLPNWQDRFKIYCFLTEPEMYKNKHLREQEGKKNLMGWHIFIWDKIKNTNVGRINNFVMKDKGKNISFRDHMYLDDSYQKLSENSDEDLKKGGSIGSLMAEREENFIKNESKIRTLKLETGKIGSYLWARCGYNFVYDLDRENVAKKVYDRCHVKGYTFTEPLDIFIATDINLADFYVQYREGSSKNKFIDFVREQYKKQGKNFGSDEREEAMEWYDEERAELVDMQKSFNSWDLAEVSVYDNHGELIHGGKEMIDTHWDGIKELSGKNEPLTRGELVAKKYSEQKRKK